MDKELTERLEQMHAENGTWPNVAHNCKLFATERWPMLDPLLWGLFSKSYLYGAAHGQFRSLALRLLLELPPSKGDEVLVVSVLRRRSRDGFDSDVKRSKSAYEDMHLAGGIPYHSGAYIAHESPWVPRDEIRWGHERVLVSERVEPVRGIVMGRTVREVGVVPHYSRWDGGGTPRQLRYRKRITAWLVQPLDTERYLEPWVCGLPDMAPAIDGR